MTASAALVAGCHVNSLTWAHAPKTHPECIGLQGSTFAAMADFFMFDPALPLASGLPPAVGTSPWSQQQTATQQATVAPTPEAPICTGCFRDEASDDYPMYGMDDAIPPPAAEGGDAEMDTDADMPPRQHVHRQSDCSSDEDAAEKAATVVAGTHAHPISIDDSQ